MAIASAQIQTVSLCQALALPFDDGLSSSLLEEGSYYTKKISMYRPGELLRMSIQEVSKSDLSELDVISDVSTSDTVRFDVSSSSHGDSDELEAEGQSGFDGLMGNITLPSSAPPTMALVHVVLAASCIKAVVARVELSANSVIFACLGALSFCGS
eukprot:CAMPEP_0169094894 /NCGR_PEP_ID=MMETSP1015-20121227/18188_1 /TAXON_ID=342587 /ORGANISM="Karlodinium micrum, Strain CCMP2283" /LENGTH=155 /DNA_ID=CAMNT_0009155581 /DNA_START=313 /DNA_END=781 /DNA_ORIENTATION=+